MEPKDECSGRCQKKEAAFRKQLVSYVLVIGFLMEYMVYVGREINHFTTFPRRM